MTNTPQTPIQPPPDDDRILLRQLFAMVQSLEQKVNERLHDTRPMWQALNERLDRLEQHLTRIERRITRVQTDLIETINRVDALEDRQSRPPDR